MVDSFKDRLNKAITDRDIKPAELARRTGINKSSITAWLKGDYEAKQDNIFKLSKALGVSEAWLMGIDTTNTPPTNIIPITDSNMVRIPIIGTIACGDPILADENIIGYRYHLRDTLPSGETFYLKAAGDSMEPTIRNGADVLIRLQDGVEDGEIAAVLVNGDTEATLKRVKKQGDIMMLVAENSAYAPYIITEHNPARILGKAVEVVFDL
ncbi:peptidase s24/s26a/s26b [Trichococcus flocculiformis]|uniref:Peptidase s24/s26a/s26b n=1 Tax=Trichococcus flocculiformis TaxID=82803 RepID=A0AB38BJY5_9LACT|nr:S24 family peptidase [Trichococcus flocculiformis]CZQ95461.1 peptidase s24/s26a/s26b [Trichococcus flocculiformis]SFI02167.1 repressor LexA [Trichococcus flocculiformis]